MENTQIACLMSVFSELEDPRIDRIKRHSLTDIIAIAICAVARGADSWLDVEVFGKSRKEWLSGFFIESGEGRQADAGGCSWTQGSGELGSLGIGRVVWGG